MRVGGQLPRDLSLFCQCPLQLAALRSITVARTFGRMRGLTVALIWSGLISLTGKAALPFLWLSWHSLSALAKGGGLGDALRVPFFVLSGKEIAKEV